MASDKLEIRIARSGGNDCLEIGGNLVSGAWCGFGSTVKTFVVRVSDLEEIIAEHKAREEADRG